MYRHYDNLALEQIGELFNPESDGELLFVLNKAKELNRKNRMGIISSPDFRKENLLLGIYVIRKTDKVIEALIAE